MKNKLIIGMSIVSIMLFSITGCSVKEDDAATDIQNPLVVETSDDLASGTSPKLSEDAAKAMQAAKTIGSIQSIILKDIEGNIVERAFTTEEMNSIETAFNDSFIMDTAYIEMITGLTMTLELENGNTVFIYSYGSEDYIVATIGDGPSYHLGCEYIGKILLEQ